MNEDALNYFFKGYFHQDWFAEYGVFENAVRDFCDHESATRIVSVKNALQELIDLGNVSEQTIFSYGGYVKPSAFELTTTEWLKQVIEIMN